jgi:hypothetical protein
LFESQLKHVKVLQLSAVDLADIDDPTPEPECTSNESIKPKKSNVGANDPSLVNV